MRMNSILLSLTLSTFGATLHAQDDLGEGPADYGDASGIEIEGEEPQQPPVDAEPPIEGEIGGADYD